MPPETNNSFIDRIFKTCLQNSVAFFILISIPITLVLIFSYSYVNRSVTYLTYHDAHQIADDSSVALDEKINSLFALGLSFTTNPRFLKDINEGKWDEANSIVDIFKKTDNEEFIDAIFLADNQGVVKTVSPPDPGVVNKNFSYRDWYNGVTSTGKPYISEVYQRANKPQINIVAVAIPIIGDNQLIKGSLVFQVSLNHFLDFVKKIPVENGGFSYVVDQKGQIVADSEFASQDKIINSSDITVVEHIHAGLAGVEEIYDPVRKDNFLAAYQPCHHGWGIVIQQPVSKVFDERQLIQFLFLFIFVFNLAINVVFVYLLRRAIEADALEFK